MKWNEPKRGDHIFVNRGWYTHHGLYLGNDQVIHYGGKINGVKERIRTISTKAFSNGDLIEINLDARGFGIYNDGAYSIDERIIRARRRIQECDYDALFNNCEQFVLWCIYGKSSSNPISNVWKALFS